VPPPPQVVVVCGTLVCEAVDEYTEQLGQHPKQVLSVNGAAVGSMRQLARLLLGCKDPFIRLETGDGQVGLLGGAGWALMGGRFPGINDDTGCACPSCF
jgi:hypothetical protein